MVPGQTARPLEVAGVRIASAICFDVAYDDVVRSQVKQGVDLVTVQTSNAMFLGTAQLEQQWVITRARAAEVGRSVVVSSINGLSGAIGPDGRVIEQLPSREYPPAAWARRRTWLAQRCFSPRRWQITSSARPSAWMAA